MKDLSFHIMDIAQNSIVAGAKNIRIEITENQKKDILEIIISDDGKGMSKEVLEKVKNPFYTTRTNRKVGFGISFLQQNIEQSEGSFQINSEPGTGTELRAVFKHSHIDRPSWGDLSGTMKMLICGNPGLNFFYRHIHNDKEFEITTEDIKNNIGDMPLENVKVSKLVGQIIHDNLREIGAIN
jgi:anti-sigma regulatory factor (Ser/Thr protein kinase)